MARLKAVMTIEVEYDVNFKDYNVESAAEAAALDENIFQEDPDSLVAWALDDDQADVSVTVFVLDSTE